MRKKFLILLVLTFVCFLGYSNAINAKSTNRQKIRNYVTKHYGKQWKIKYVSWDSPIIINRTKYKNKKIIIVDIARSQSTGKKDPRNGHYYGKILNSKYWCWYNKKVKKGKIVTQYSIYSPYSNEPDDIVAVIDNGIIR